MTFKKKIRINRGWFREEEKKLNYASQQTVKQMNQTTQKNI